MGTSVTIIAVALGDFPALAEAIGFRRTGGDAGGDAPPVGYSQTRGQALIWIDQTLRDDLAAIDFAALSHSAPIWVLTVIELEGYSILERYEAGEVTCALWAPPGGARPPQLRGSCPFDLAELDRRNAELCLDRGAALGIVEECSPFTVPLLAFHDLTGVEYDGEGSEAVEPADATFPLEDAG